MLRLAAALHASRFGWPQCSDGGAYPTWHWASTCSFKKHKLELTCITYIFKLGPIQEYDR